MTDWQNEQYNLKRNGKQIGKLTICQKPFLLKRNFHLKLKYQEEEINYKKSDLKQKKSERTLEMSDQKLI